MLRKAKKEVVIPHEHLNPRIAEDTSTLLTSKDEILKRAVRGSLFIVLGSVTRYSAGKLDESIVSPVAYGTGLTGIGFGLYDMSHALIGQMVSNSIWKRFRENLQNAVKKRGLIGLLKEESRSSDLGRKLEKLGSEGAFFKIKLSKKGLHIQKLEKMPRILKGKVVRA